MISLETPQRKWASSRLEGRTSWIFSGCGTCSRLTMGTSGTRSGGFKKGQSPCEFLGGLSGFISRQCRGLRPCVELSRNLRIPVQCLHGSGGTSGVSPGESVLVSIGGMHCDFLQSCISSVTLPFAWIKGSVAFPRDFPTRLSHGAFPRGFPTGLSHVPPW